MKRRDTRIAIVAASRTSAARASIRTREVAVKWPRRAEKPGKRVELREFQTIGGHATPLVVEISATEARRKTVFHLRDVRYDRGLPESEFSIARLNRGR